MIIYIYGIIGFLSPKQISIKIHTIQFNKSHNFIIKNEIAHKKNILENLILYKDIEVIYE